MCMRTDTTYELEEAELVDEFRTGDMSFEEFEKKLSDLRDSWEKFNSGE